MLTDIATIALTNLGVTVLYATVALAFLAVFDQLVWPDVSFREEIRKGNMAVAVFASVVVYCIIFGAFRIR